MLLPLLSFHVAARAQEPLNPGAAIGDLAHVLRLPAEDPFLATIESLKRSVAPIVCLVQQATEMQITASMGTAVFTSTSGDFLTAAHVLQFIEKDRKGCPLTALLLPPSTWLSTSSTETLLWFLFETGSCTIDVELDIAKCHSKDDFAQSGQAATAGIRPVRFEFSSPRDGTPVAFTGFPLSARDPMTSRTGIAGYRSGSTGTRFIPELILDHMAWQGGSGSPVYLSDGSVIGIILAQGIEQATGIAVARPVETFRHLVQVDVSQRNAGSPKR